MKKQRSYLVLALGLLGCAVDLVRMAARPAADLTRETHDNLLAGLAQIGGGS